MLRLRRNPHRPPQSDESLRLAEELAERLEAQERETSGRFVGLRPLIVPPTAALSP